MAPAPPGRGIPYPDLDLIAAADPGPRLRRHVPLALALLALTGLAFGLARPEVYRAQPRERATIMLAVDVSGSMAATTSRPTACAPRRTRPGPSPTRCPPVPGGPGELLRPRQRARRPDHRPPRAQARVESLVPDGATAVGEAIAASLDAIRTSQGVAQDGAKLEAARIVVLSDGATTVGRRRHRGRAGPAGRRAGLHRRAGDPGRGAAQRPARAARPRGHEALADATGGTAYESEDADDVSAVYEQLGSFVGTERVKTEVTAWPAGIAAALLILAGVAAWRSARGCRDLPVGDLALGAPGAAGAGGRAVLGPADAGARPPSGPSPASWPPSRAGARRCLRAAAAVVALLAVGAAIVALARPSIHQTKQERRSTVMITLDISDSMKKTDLQPSRLDAAVDAAERFLDQAPDDTAVGVTTFADRASVILAPTTDRDDVRRALDGISGTRVGTALGEAVTVSLAALQAAGAVECRRPPTPPTRPAASWC